MKFLGFAIDPSFDSCSQRGAIDSIRVAFKNHLAATIALQLIRRRGQNFLRPPRGAADIEQKHEFWRVPNQERKGLSFRSARLRELFSRA